MMRRVLAGLAAFALVVQSVAAVAAAPPPVAAEHGMVVSAQPLASAAGVAVLKSGGNAVDAAVAVAYALAVTFPAAGNIGGGGFMTIRLADGQATFLDFRETAPGAARADMYLDAHGQVIPGLSTRGYRAVGVPGTVAGLEYARAKYGTRPRAALIAPAIALARDGFVLSQGDAALLADATQDFTQDPAAAAIFLDHGAALGAGSRLVQPELARSLEAIAEHGPDAFYRGPIARAIVDASARHGGILTQQDFATYKVRELAPLACDYRGFHIISAPPPSSGGAVLCESLNILSGYPLEALGWHSAQATHYLIEALRRAFHDRNLTLGDPDFVHADVDRLVSPAYAAGLRAGIAPDRATASASLGGISGGNEGNNTTHFSIVDAAGNAVSLTYTLNDWFGARVVAPGTGIILNDEMDDFTAKPGTPNMYGLIEGPNNAIAPGKRPLSSMTPTIVTRDGQLAMVLGTPGGSRIPTAVLQVLLNLIDYHMQLQEAVDAPRLHQQWQPDVTYYEPFALSADTMAVLAAKGQKLAAEPYHNHIAAIVVGGQKVVGAPVGAPSEGKARLYGAIDPRLDSGDAEGY